MIQTKTKRQGVHEINHCVSIIANSKIEFGKVTQNNGNMKNPA